MFEGVAQNDRRAGARRRVLYQGKLTSAGAAFSGDCLVRDLSSTGARITSQEHELLDKAVSLVIVRDGMAHETRTAWRNGSAMGLEFTSSHDLNGAVPQHLRHIRRLWVEQLPR